MQHKHMYVMRSQKHALTPASINLQKCKHTKLTAVVTWQTCVGRCLFWTSL